MHFKDLVKRSGRSLLSAKTRTLLTAFAIGVGAFALSLTLAASNGARDYGNNLIRNNFDPTELIVTKDKNFFSSTEQTQPQVYNPSFGNVTSESGNETQVQELDAGDLTQISQIKGVSSVTPDISLALQYITRNGERKYVATLEAYNAYKSPVLLAGNIPANIPSGSLILPQSFLYDLGFKTAQSAINQTVRLSVSKQANLASLISALGSKSSDFSNLASQTAKEYKFKIIAVTQKPSSLIEPGSALYLYANDADVIKLNNFTTEGTNGYQKYISAYAKITDGNNTAKLVAAQNRIKAAGYSAQSVIDTEQTLNQVINVIQGIVIVFGLIALVASLFGVINTMYISVIQRTREIGLMKALGMHKKDVSKLFRFEAGLIGLLGGLIGSILAFVVGSLLNPTISKSLSLGSAHLIQFSWSQEIILIIVLLLVATIAGLLPARKAAKLNPIDALRTE